MITGLLQKRKNILTGNKLEERRSFQSTVQGDYVGVDDDPKKGGDGYDEERKR